MFTSHCARHIKNLSIWGKHKYTHILYKNNDKLITNQLAETSPGAFVTTAQQKQSAMKKYIRGQNMFKKYSFLEYFNHK